jgi:DNA-binding beta-propeller fold protein YncE
VFHTDDFEFATIPVGDLPHGIWPSGDGTRVYVGLENAIHWLQSIRRPTK